MVKDRFGEPGDPVEADPASYYSSEQSDLRYARAERNDITARTGGAAEALDNIATADDAWPTGLSIKTRSGANGAREEWILEDGTDAEDAAAGVVRPDDYDGTTNARVWKQIL